MKQVWVFLAVAGLVGCRKEEPQSEVRVEVERVHAPGYVEPEGRLRRLAFAGAGVLAAVEVELGEVVEAGELLARLEWEVETANLVQARAGLERARAELARLRDGEHPADIRALQSMVVVGEEEAAYFAAEVRRLEGLEGNGVARQEVDLARHRASLAVARLARARAELEAAEKRVRPAELAVAEAAVEVARSAVEVAESELRRRELRAPSAGRVLEVILREGERVDAGPVMVFAPAGAVRVRAEVDEGFVGLVQAGQAATIEAPGGEVARGRVVQVKALMGDKSVFTRDSRERMDVQVFEVLVDLDGEAPDWPHGLEVRVEIEVWSEE